VEFAQVEARRLGADDMGVDRVLDLVGATEFADAKLGRLSQGQLQMAALAVAMAPSPGVLLADEPTSALDRAARQRIVDTLLRVNEDQGTTVVVVTHDPEVADRLPRTVTIRDGRIGGEGRRGEEYAVVTADGFIPIPVHIRERLPPGTLLRIEQDEGGYRVVPEVIGQDPGSESKD
jgi:ABC-type lipoprotein export system ATPase subunit